MNSNDIILPCLTSENSTSLMVPSSYLNTVNPISMLKSYNWCRVNDTNDLFFDYSWTKSWAVNPLPLAMKSSRTLCESLHPVLMTVSDENSLNMSSNVIQNEVLSCLSYSRMSVSSSFQKALIGPQAPCQVRGLHKFLSRRSLFPYTSLTLKIW